VKTSRIEGLSPLHGKDPSKTRGEQAAIIFETPFWTPVDAPPHFGPHYRHQNSENGNWNREARTSNPDV
jgi:hypothetical protein